MLISAHEEAFRTLARECHKAAEDRLVFCKKEDNPYDQRSQFDAALVLGSLGQALERAADSLAERNGEISANFARMRD